MENPTNGARLWVSARADSMDVLAKALEDEAKAILAESVYQNSIRGAAESVVTSCDGILGMVQKLRKAIHDDFGAG